MDAYLSRDLLCQKIHSLRDAAFGADCLTSFKILKIITVGFKKWILVMLSRIVTCCKNCQILIRSPLEVKSLHLLVLLENKFENCHMKYSLSTLIRAVLLFHRWGGGGGGKA